MEVELAKNKRVSQIRDIDGHYASRSMNDGIVTTVESNLVGVSESNTVRRKLSHFTLFQKQSSLALEYTAPLVIAHPLSPNHL